jgi:hypothetical protein
VAAAESERHATLILITRHTFMLKPSARERSGKRRAG